MTPIQNVSGIGPHLAAILTEKGIPTAEQLATTPPADLLDIPGIGPRRADTLLAAARQATTSALPQASEAQKAPTAASVKPVATKAPQKTSEDADAKGVAKKPKTSKTQKLKTDKQDKKKEKKNSKKKDKKKAAKKDTKKARAKDKAAEKKSAKKAEKAKKKGKAKKK